MSWPGDDDSKTSELNIRFQMLVNIIFKILLQTLELEILISKTLILRK